MSIKYEKRILYDNYKLNEIVKKGEIIVKIGDTDEILFRKMNKIILPGSAYTAAKHFNIIIPHNTPSYNEALELENTIIDTSIRPNLDEDVCLFSIGTDGCGVDQHQIYDVNYSMWCKPEDLIPFRVVDPEEDLNANLREVYFGRKSIFSDTKIAYYFKKFDSEPEFRQQYISDGTPIDFDVYNSYRSDEIETFIAIKLKINIEDVKEFFDSTIGINHTKINTISLCKAWFTTIDGMKYFQDIRPITKVNFSNEPLFALNKGLDIYYNIYY